MKTEFFSRITAAFLLLGIFPVPAMAMDWQIKNLGVLPGAVSSSGTAINDLGQVAGDVKFGPYPEQYGSVFRQYSFLSGPNGGSLAQIADPRPGDGFRDFHAVEVNNSGQVVGSAVLGSSITTGWVTDPNGQNLKPFDLFFSGVDINNSGTAVFQQHFSGGAYISEGGEFPQPTISSSDADFPQAINDANQIVLNAGYPGGQDGTGALWSRNVGLQHIFFLGESTQLFDINNSGQVLGRSVRFGDLLVMNPVTRDFEIIPLPGTLLTSYPSFPGSTRFNDAGQIVGQYTLDGSTFSFLASSTTREVINLSMEEDILAAGWSNIVVSDINNLGQITGTGVINGKTRAFLLTPVPEPETWAMMLAGLSMLGFVRRRKSGKV